MKRFDSNKPVGPRKNEQIRFPQVLVIHGSENLGVMHPKEALKTARSYKLDLVEVSPDARPPVCRIMDYGKYNYSNSKSKQKNKRQKTKEVRISCRIGEHDLLTKRNLAEKFLGQGHKVLLKLELKRRENMYKDIGFSMVKKFCEYFNDFSINRPNLDGRFITCVIEPKKCSDK